MNKSGEDGMFAEERKHMIVDLVNKNIKTTVNNLCEEFSVSPATIRNDLRELEEAGLFKLTQVIADRRRGNGELLAQIIYCRFDILIYQIDNHMLAFFRKHTVFTTFVQYSLLLSYPSISYTPLL